tara:strand:+ start:279 stop:1169 length:891 start_codon:yes stop_codon:yes gene_type:complete
MGLKLSIVIPSFNSEKTLEQTLHSIYDSDYKDFEVIFVDDRSNDNSVQIAKKFPVNVVLLEKNSGAAVARNRGTKEANGEIIVFVDSDVVLYPDTFSKIDKAFNEETISAIQTIYSKENTLNNFASQYQNLYQHYNFNLIKLKYIQIASTYCFAIRKKDYIPFDIVKKTAEDGEWGFKISQRGKILFDKDIEVKHLQKFTLKKVLRRSFILSRDKIRSVKQYKGQIKSDLKATHHGKNKLMSILFSPFPPIFWVLNIDFFKFIYDEKGTKFLIKTFLFHEINYMMCLLGIVRGGLS